MAGINDKASFEIAIVSLLLQTSFAMLFKVLEKREFANDAICRPLKIRSDSFVRVAMHRHYVDARKRIDSAFVLQDS